MRRKAAPGTPSAAMGKPLAVTTKRKSGLLPDLPTMEQLVLWEKPIADAGIEKQ
ncbi:hypothetical protein H8B02_28940 [Bradyrhizobium sp. Pear77]|uniref:hypothetical protein n=1 Tax=Bradyrhizobium altum TaxID=1571202 RepID=UPI001E3D138D|nr:hypothetical protein [Bradyrhizobium altum]MCC8957316.1 hypothetical protein [Bradyrhizobium altum]